jgi:GTP-binding protein EngB required for normal cell division
MTTLAPRHQSSLVSSLMEIDAFLSEAYCRLDAMALRSPFAQRLDDITPIRRQLITEDVDRMHDQMRSILARQGIVLPTPGASSSAAWLTAINRAVIAAEALSPHHRGDDDALTDDEEAELNRIVSILLDRLLDMENHLAASEAVRPSASEGHEARGVEIVVFGRVNAGKSSLLNVLLEGDFLPIGALPATAVPVRIAYGREPIGFAQFANGAEETFDLGRLAEFAAEQYNPMNGRHVTHLRLELPARRLRDGIALVDTPGMEHGALPENLPPCDVGLVAIDATGSLSLDETCIIEALRRAGVAIVVALTKADLLTSDDRWRVYGFACREIKARTGMDLPIHLASTAQNVDAALRNEWIAIGLDPCLHHFRLGEAHATGTRASRTAPEPSGRDAIASRGVAGHAGGKSELRCAQASIDAAQRDRLAPEHEAARQAAALVDEVAHNAAVLWRKAGDDATIDVTTLVLTSLDARCRRVANDASRELLSLRAQCANALALTGDRAAGNLPRPQGMPAFAGSLPPAATWLLHKPPLSFLGLRWIRRCWREALMRSGLAAQAAAVMNPYFEQVNAWGMRMLAELSRRLADGTEELL